MGKIPAECGKEKSINFKKLSSSSVINRTVNITDNNIANQLLNQQLDTARIRFWVTTIRKIVQILGLIINGLGDLAGIMEDCDGN